MIKKKLLQNGASRKSNIYDVAEEAGVSIGTISRAMNNPAIVFPETLKQIETAMKKLRYRPSPEAKCLAQQKSDQIAVFLSPHDEVHYALVVMNFLVGIIWGAEKNRLRMTAHMLFKTEEENAAVDVTTSLEGAIMMADMKRSGALRELEQNKVPVVYLNCTDHPKKHRITVDDAAGAGLALEHLIQLGHERIAFLTGEMTTISGLARARGCQETLKKHGLLEATEKNRFFRNARFDQKIAYAETHDLLRQTPRPTAIFAASDWMALGAITAIREKGLAVPRDVSVVGYDNSILASQVTPPLTTVHQPFVEMGKEAVAAILKIREESGRVYHKTLEPSLVIRETTAPPAK